MFWHTKNHLVNIQKFWELRSPIPPPLWEKFPKNPVFLGWRPLGICCRQRTSFYEICQSTQTDNLCNHQKGLSWAIREDWCESYCIVNVSCWAKTQFILCCPLFNTVAELSSGTFRGILGIHRYYGFQFVFHFLHIFDQVTAFDLTIYPKIWKDSTYICMLWGHTSPHWYITKSAKSSESMSEIWDLGKLLISAAWQLTLRRGWEWRHLHLGSRDYISDYYIHSCFSR